MGILLIEIFVPYRYYCRVLKFLTLSLLAYVATGIIIQPDWGSLLLKTIVPSIQLTPQFLALTVALVGTTISPYLFFWQASEEVEEVKLHHRRRRGKDTARQESSLRKQIRALRLDTAFGLFAASIGFWFIVMTTSSTLHAHGITNIQSADQAAAALKPLVHGFPHAGEIAKAIFAIGIVGTGLLAVPVLAGSAAYGIAEAFGWREGLEQTLNHARGFYARDHRIHAGRAGAEPAGRQPDRGAGLLSGDQRHRRCAAAGVDPAGRQQSRDPRRAHQWARLEHARHRHDPLHGRRRHRHDRLALRGVVKSRTLGGFPHCVVSCRVSESDASLTLRRPLDATPHRARQPLFALLLCSHGVLVRVGRRASRQPPRR